MDDSQMSEAKIEKTQIEILSDQFSERFIADGEVIIFDGFLKVYLEGKDEETYRLLTNLSQVI